MSAIYTENDIKDILNQYYKGSIKNLVYSRFGISISEDYYVTMPQDMEKVIEKLDIEDILNKAKTERNNYK